MFIVICVRISFLLARAGLIMSITQTCFVNNRLIGIVGLEVNMVDLLEDITYFKEGDRSYAFIIDRKGMFLMYMDDLIKCESQGCFS